MNHAMIADYQALNYENTKCIHQTSLRDKIQVWTQSEFRIQNLKRTLI